MAAPHRRMVLFSAGIALVAAAVVGIVLAWPGPGGGAGEPPSPSAEAWADIPKIDVHVHVGPELAEQLLSIMDRQGIDIALNASGGPPGGGLEQSAEIAARSGRRLLPYCNLAFGRVYEPGWEAYVRETLAACDALGAVGLKIGKGLGLGITGPSGELLTVDDPRLDIVFAVAGERGLPVLIHTGDPQAFFRPATEDNERFAELRAHPSWSFHGERPDGFGRWPTWEELFAQYERRVARHPATTFVGAHFGNAPEEPRRVARMLERHPNLYVETGARIPEIGRHPPEELRAIFERFPDRILFGTDTQVTEWGLVLGSVGEEPDPPSRVPAFFEAHWRYFESRGRDLSHPTPIQGDWTIDGLGLDRAILEKLYYRNAVRVFSLPTPAP